MMLLLLAMATTALGLIQNCLTYSDAPTDTTCSQCATNYVLFSNSCQQIANCQTQQHYYQSSDTTQPTLACTLCQTGYQLHVNQCSANIVNCTIYDLTQATLTCTACSTGFALVGGSTCVAVIANCSTYQTSGQCKTCNTGFILEGLQCFTIIKNCQTYTQDGQCANCMTNFTLTQGLCVTLVNNCATYTKDNTCSQCTLPYALAQENVCVTSIPNCATYLANGQCNTCNALFYLSNQACVPNMINCQVQVDNECTKCNDGFIQNTKRTKCVAMITNCANTMYNDSTQFTYCGSCDQNYAFTQSNSDQGCTLISSVSICQQYDPASSSICKQCIAGYALYTDGTCQACAIPYCSQCVFSNIVGQQCTACNAGFTLGSEGQSCNTSCSFQYNLQNCNQCTSTACSVCAVGYYVNNSGLCTSCSSKYSNCSSCSPTACNSCNNGYYFNTITNYCTLCSNLIPGCSSCTNQGVCLSCNPNGYYLSANTCQACSNSFQNCQTCLFKQGVVQCQICITNYAGVFDNLNQFYCKNCATLNEVIGCSQCNSTTFDCSGCQSGMYLNITSPVPSQLKTTYKCLPCINNCAICSDGSSCNTCNTGYLLHNSTCDQNITNMTLTPELSSVDALSYTSIAFQSLATKGASYYTIDIQANLKTGHFCSSDKQCNSLGDCFSLWCRCIQGQAGSRCQYTTSTNMTLTHNSVLTYLQNFKSFDVNQISIMLLLSDTTYNISDTNLNRFINILQIAIQNYDIRYLTIVSNIIKNIQSLNTITNAKIDSLDQLLQSTIISQSNQMQISQVLNITGPFHRQILAKFDLFDPSSVAKFNASFVHPIETACNNDFRLLYPNQYFQNYLLLQQLQGNASTPLVINQMFFFFPFHKTTGAQLINSTVSRVDFYVGGSLIHLTQLKNTNNYVYIAKQNQIYSSPLEVHNCVYWNETQQIWVEISTFSRCTYYTICRTDHFTDFATYVYVNNSYVATPIKINIIPEEFSLKKSVQNGGFALSIAILGLFIVGSFFLGICSSNKQRNRKVPDHASQYQSALQMDSQPDTERQLTKIAKQPQDVWLIFPLYAIFMSEGIPHKIQKLSLFCIQLQLYVMLTSIFITITPFSYGKLTAYYIIVVLLTWVGNYVIGILAVAFRRKRTKQIYGCYWLLYLTIHAGLLFISIWQMYGQSLTMDLYLLVGFFIEFVIDAILCDLFVTYLFQSMFPGKIEGIWKLVKTRGYL